MRRRALLSALGASTALLGGCPARIGGTRYRDADCDITYSIAGSDDIPCDDIDTNRDASSEADELPDLSSCSPGGAPP